MTNTDLRRGSTAPQSPASQRRDKPSKPLWRGLALGLALSVTLAGCGGGGNNNCGSAGNTRVLRCAP